jgi:hypothetical protein
MLMIMIGIRKQKSSNSNVQNNHQMHIEKNIWKNKQILQIIVKGNAKK